MGGINAQIVSLDLLRNDETFWDSNIYKVIGNILIEKTSKKQYS
jgi:hypothetical protein